MISTGNGKESGANGSASSMLRVRITSIPPGRYCRSSSRSVATKLAWPWLTIDTDIKLGCPFAVSLSAVSRRALPMEQTRARQRPCGKRLYYLRPMTNLASTLSRSHLGELLVQRLTPLASRLATAYHDDGGIDSFVVDDVFPEDVATRLAGRFPKASELMRRD